ncbi:MAG: efflux RND transporter periplasmic adaptor subunit [Gammaproteobacteria bacterium]|nr:efflux RND transporter periplasmic adaptor subunit [Gammaproteobacteria bacterium]
MIVNPCRHAQWPFLIVALLLAGCADEPPPAQAVTPRVKYFVVGEQATGQSRRISGKVVAADSTSLSFSIGGTAEEVLVRQGDVVSKGQLLARLDAEPLRLAVENARAQLSVARAKVVETKQVYERTAGLVKKKVVSRAEFETATANRAAARGNLRSAKADLESQERDLARTELAAPFAGTVASRSIDPFQEVSAGSEAFVLQSAGALEVEVQVPETLIRDVDYNQAVQVTFPTLPDASVGGVVSEISSRTQVGNAFPVTVRLSPTEVDLRPGMTASVTFNFDQYLDGRTVYLIPLSALAIEAGSLRNAGQADTASRKAPVFVVGADGKLELRDLRVGDLRGNLLEVFEGLEAGERIVSAGVALLREGMRVELWSPDQGLTDG